MEQLFPHQQQAASFVTSLPRSYLYHEPGLGKTRTTLTAAATMGATPNTLVVAPAFIRDSRVWQREADQVGFPGKLTVISYHQLLRRPPSKSDILVFDEAHRLKSRKASWSAPARSYAARSDKVVLLSGTPIPNRPDDLWNQLGMLREMPAFWKWAQKWLEIVPTKYSSYALTGRLRKCTEDCGPLCEHQLEFRDHYENGQWHRAMREDVLSDLPPLIGADDPVYVPMAPRQRQEYKQMAKSLIAEMPDATTLVALTYASRFVHLRRISFALDADHSGKLTYLKEYLPDRRQPTVLVAWYRSTAEELVRLSLSLGLRTISLSASLSASARADAIQQFQAGEYDVMVASLGVIAEGVTLTRADTIVFVERAYAPSVNEQAMRRLHRIGQTRPVNVVHLVSENSVDAGAWELVKGKDLNIRAVLGI